MDLDDDDFDTKLLFQQLVVDAVRGARAGSSGYVRVDCPCCAYRLGKPDRKRCLGYSPAKRRWSCWRCGAKGSLRHVPDEEGLPASDAVLPEPVIALQLPEEFALLSEEPARSSLMFAPARDYVHKARNLSEDAVRRAGIGACLTGRFAGRVVVPVRDVVGKLRWYVGRTWFKSSMPYMYPKGARDGVMFNEAALDVHTDVPALIVEGVFDALALWPHGVAVLGKTTDAHFKRFRTSCRPVVLVPDGDAWKEGLVLRDRMRAARLRCGLVKLPPKRDPDELVGPVFEAAPLSLDAGRYVEITE